MPLGWKPSSDRIGLALERENFRIEQAKKNLFWVPPSAGLEVPVTQGLETVFPERPALVDFYEKKKGPFSYTDVVPEVLPPEEQVSSPKPLERIPVKVDKEEVLEAVSTERVPDPEVPWWMRGLQAFGAPFEWVDENIIKPGLGLVGTAMGVPEVGREAGEDFWEWKKRSWEQWDTPTLISIPAPWADDGKWDIDFKGIMQTAPWLLIPGPGGIATRLGKLGTVGAVAAKVVKFSPWGLAETATSAVVKALGKPVMKAMGETSKTISKRLYGEYIPPPHHPDIDFFNKVLKEDVLPKKRQYQALIPELRGRQYGSMDDVREAWKAGHITNKEFDLLMPQARQAEGGVKRLFKTTTEFTAEQMENIRAPIRKAAEDNWKIANALEAINRLFYDYVVPEPAELQLLARIFGGETADLIRQLGGVKSGVLGNIWDILNIPRAALASGDLSGMGRQGLVLGLTHPKAVPKAFKNQIRSFFSEKHALDIDDVLRADPEFIEFVRATGYMAPLRKTGVPLEELSESFMSTLATKIPFVRRSERAFINYLNTLRLSAWKSAKASYVAQGAGQQELGRLAKFINYSSGRGDIPMNMNDFAPAINAIAFSSRLQFSRLQLPRQLGRMLLSKNPYERKEAGRALATFMGGGIGLLTLLNTTGMAKVSGDPRSVDFGKIRFKEGEDKEGKPIYSETRLDIWTGFIQYARFAAQMLTGERKTAYGNLNKSDRDDIAWRFFQSKTSPAFGLLIDLIKGENYMGEPLFEGTSGAAKTARNRLLPLALQDVIDGMEEGGINKLWTAIPAGIGIGTLTYVNDLVKVKERIANEQGFESWDEIDPKTQVEIMNSNRELQTAQIIFDRRVMGTAWGDWRANGNAIEDVFQNDVELATLQYREEGDGVQFREKVNDAFTKRKGGYAAREEDDRFVEIVRRQQSETTEEMLLTFGPEQTAIHAYNKALYSDDMYDDFGDYRFDEAEVRRQVLREQLGEEMYEYIQKYQNEKYAVLPPEFQELAQAKIILKPYWDVRARVEKLFGLSFSESRAGDSLISKLRKTKRMEDPRMEEAYQRFYAKQ